MKTAGKILAGLLAVLLLLGAAGWGIWFHFSRQAAYAVPEDGKEALFAGKKVMVIVPHEDDELNLFGGLFEAYLRHGSTVKVVFVTNGDLYLPRETRIGEAIRAMHEVGVAEEDIIFLGYGDGYYGRHLYNAYDGERMISQAGFMETHGADFHPAFAEERPFTRENFIGDIKACILQERPDVVFCNDYDSHPDHQAVSLGFEEAMGEILREEADYRPAVYKGYAYSTGFYAPEDFYASLNILSTRNPSDSDSVQEGIYRWSERVRFPVSAASLSRSLYQCSVYRAAVQHESQNAKIHAISVINGDKVFWQRRTDSLCAKAVITASSGHSERLNDFKLLDSTDLMGWAAPYDGVWTPEKGDADRSFTVTFAEESTVASVRLYGSPSKEDRVLNALVTLSDGTKKETGPIGPEGTEIQFEGTKAVSGFTVKLLETEGEKAGITEAEAFAAEAACPGAYLKMMAGDDFVYDYMTEQDGKAVFTLYEAGADASDSLVLSCDNPHCTAVSEKGTITVTCPKGEKCILSAEDPESGLTDRVRVSNPGMMTRWGRDIERIWYRASGYAMREGSFLYRVTEAVERRLGK